MTEQKQRDDSLVEVQKSGSWDPEEVFPTSQESGGDAGLQGLLDLTKAQLSRTVQEFDSFRKRAKEERIKTILFCNEALVLDLLPILDDLDRALAHLSAMPGELGEGLQLVLKHFHQVLAKRNIQTIDPSGVAFDPLRHEAVQIEESEGLGAGMVVRTLQKGYLCSGRLLRPAKVAITPMRAARTDTGSMRKISGVMPAAPVSEAEKSSEVERSPGAEKAAEIAMAETALASEAVAKASDHAQVFEELVIPEILEEEQAGVEEAKEALKPKANSLPALPSDGNPGDKSWVIDDEALAELEGALDESEPVKDSEARIRSLL
jgi:molecular chaperone GrpE